MVLIFLAILLSIAVVNVVAWRNLVLVHPRQKWLIRMALLLGNAMWPFFPLLNARTSFSRAVRATLGPPWFAWVVYALAYSLFITLCRLPWLVAVVRARRRSAGAHQPAFRSGITSSAAEPVPVWCGNSEGPAIVGPRSFAAFASVPSRVFLTLLFAGSIAGCWQALVPLRIERVAVAIDELPATLEGKRIVLMGDLHVGLYSRPARLRQIFVTAGELRPDVVLLAGDLIDDDPHFVPKLLTAAGFLPSAIPIFAVPGNHEMYGAPLEAIRRLRGSRIRLLVNEGVAAGGLWIAGISDYAAQLPALRPDFSSALLGKPAGAMPLLLSHQPKSFSESIARGIPLTLCAHTHGGQFGFRPLRWSLAGVFLPYHMGLYRRGRSQLYVNTGTGYWLLPFRLGMPPEITLIELHRR